MATFSHHDCRVNSPTVATRKPAMVNRHITLVIDQRSPEVVTPLVANAGVSQSQVLPARNRATPPTLRMVTMTITPLNDSARSRMPPKGTKAPPTAPLAGISPGKAVRHAENAG